MNSCLCDGGAERVMTLLANEFVKREYETHMVLVRDNKEKIYYLEPEVELHELKYGQCFKLLKFFKRIRLLRDTIKDVNPDVIISFTLDINVVTIIASSGLSKRVIVSERNYPKAKESIARTVLRWCGEKILYPKVHRIVLQTEMVRECFGANVKSKSVVIPNPINPDVPERYDGEREKSIVAVGRLDKQKNFPMLLRAYARFNKIHNDYQLIIYGDGPLREELYILATDLRIAGKVLMPGYVSDVNEKMKKAYVYVSSSDYEGISNTMLEALAMGIPSICTDCPAGGAAMMIKNRENGILIPVGDEDALLDGLCELVENEALAQRLSLNAVKICNEVSIKKIADNWEKIVRY